MILGIGFIMIAAVFPVALRQTQQSGEETVASTIAKGGAAVLSDIAAMPDPRYPLPPVTNPPTPPTTYLPVTGTINGPFGDVVAAGDFWNAVSGNLILPSDNRYAWVPLYRRDPGSPYAQIIVIACQVRNRTNYDGNAPQPAANGADLYYNRGMQPNLQAKAVLVTVTHNTTGGADTVTFAPATSGQNFVPAVAPGCYVVIAHDPFGPSVQAPIGPLTANGYVYRVGNPVLNVANTWELQPGNDTQNALYWPGHNPSTGANTAVRCNAFIVGQGYDPGNPGFNFNGGAQDVAVYTTFVKAQ